LQHAALLFEQALVVQTHFAPQHLAPHLHFDLQQALELLLHAAVPHLQPPSQHLVAQTHALGLQQDLALLPHLALPQVHLAPQQADLHLQADLQQEAALFLHLEVLHMHLFPQQPPAHWHPTGRQQAEAPHFLVPQTHWPLQQAVEQRHLPMVQHLAWTDPHPHFFEPQTHFFSQQASLQRRHALLLMALGAFLATTFLVGAILATFPMCTSLFC